MPNVDTAHPGQVNPKKADFNAAKILDNMYPDWILNMNIAEAEIYIDTNVVDLDTAKDILKHLASVTIINTKAVRWFFQHIKPENIG